MATDEELPFTQSDVEALFQFSTEQEKINAVAQVYEQRCKKLEDYFKSRVHSVEQECKRKLERAEFNYQQAITKLGYEDLVSTNGILMKKSHELGIEVLNLEARLSDARHRNRGLLKLEDENQQLAQMVVNANKERLLAIAEKNRMNELLVDLTRTCAQLQQQ